MENEIPPKISLRIRLAFKFNSNSLKKIEILIKSIISSVFLQISPSFKLDVVCLWNGDLWGVHCIFTKITGAAKDEKLMKLDIHPILIRLILSVPDVHVHFQDSPTGKTQLPTVVWKGHLELNLLTSNTRSGTVVE